MGFAWFCIVSLVMKLGFNFIIVVRLFGLVCGFGILVAVVWVACQFFGERKVGILFVLVLVSSLFWVVNALIGLEIIVVIFSVLVGVLFFICESRSRCYFWWVGVVWSVSYLVRFEVLVFVFVMLLWGFWDDWCSRVGLCETLVWVFCFGAGFVVLSGFYFFWCLYYYRVFLFNTFEVKYVFLFVVFLCNLWFLF